MAQTDDIWCKYMLDSMPQEALHSFRNSDLLPRPGEGGVAAEERL